MASNKRKTSKKKKKASQKKATTRAGGRPAAGAPLKADFIRSKLAEGLGASAIVKAAAEQGMKIQPSQIYKLKRKSARKGSGPAGKKTTPASAPKAGKLTASDFIRQHPDKTATEITKLGKAQGFKFSSNLVYATRAYDKKKSGAPKGKPGRKPAGKWRRRATATPPSSAWRSTSASRVRGRSSSSSRGSGTTCSSKRYPREGYTGQREHTCCPTHWIS